MRYLLIFLLCGFAQAADYWVWKNAQDYEFVLTNDLPDWCGGMSMMYSVSPEGKVHYGCWRQMNDRIHVEFRDGMRYAFDPQKFQRRAEKTNQLK